MTLLDFEELAAYWAEYPPLHILIAGYLGLGKDKRQRRAPAILDDVSELHRTAESDAASVLSELGIGLGNADVHAGLAPVVLDFAELRRSTNGY